MHTFDIHDLRPIRETDSDLDNLLRRDGIECLFALLYRGDLACERINVALSHVRLVQRAVASLVAKFHDPIHHDKIVRDELREAQIGPLDGNELFVIHLLPRRRPNYPFFVLFQPSARDDAAIVLKNSSHWTRQDGGEQARSEGR